MTRKDMEDMWAAAKLNRQKLETCVKHHFVLVGIVQSHAVCTRCGGRMSTSSVYAYARGYAAAGADPRDVLTEDFM